MIIASALYYPGSLDNPQSLVRDNRWYPGKASNAFPVWWAYLRRACPDVRVHLFADAKSPVPIRPLLGVLSEAWEEVGLDGQGLIHDPFTGFDETDPLVTVQWLDQYAGGYFRPMQRNLVEAICLAYRANEDLLWWDNDAFCATDIRPLVRDVDFAAASIEHHQMTAASVFTYVSARRLHALDELTDLPSFLTTLLNEGPTETRMHLLQEGGLYKLFCYGATRDLGRDIQLSHLSCYDRFLTFLRRNPLDTSEYRDLMARLEAVDWAKMPGVQRAFWDMLMPENTLLPP